MFARNNRLTTSRARLYETVRSAHLERAHELEPAAIVYRNKRYDFDDSLTAGLELVGASRLRTALLVTRSRLEVLEVNEPLMLESLPTTCMTLLFLSARHRLGRPIPRVVTYAIGNADPFRQLGNGRWKTRLRRRLERYLARYAWRRIDRIVFGTESARATYAALLPERGAPESKLVVALPEVCPICSVGDKDSSLVVYLGALVARKGFPLLAKTWPIVVQRSPGVRLEILGKGELESLAKELASSESSAELTVDPARSAIHKVLARAQVLVLPSQSSSTWREQVGLPIVEALAHGCSIVTTTETGLATWLREHGHTVVDARSDELALATAIHYQLERRASAGSVIATLPKRDGRLAADDWLFDTGVLHNGADSDESADSNVRR